MEEILACYPETMFQVVFKVMINAELVLVVQVVIGVILYCTAKAIVYAILHNRKGGDE